LKGIVVDKRLLDGMQFALGRNQAFHRGDLAALVHDGETQAREHPFSVDKNGARTALPVIATFLCAGQANMVAQSVKQAGAIVEREVVGLFVDTY